MGMSRRYVFPEPGDTLATLGARVMPGEKDAPSILAAWNLHLVMRPFAIGEPGEILCTDIVYLEPPPPA
jgi:hypothetical protein